MNTIPTELIEKALALCGKTMRDMGDRDIRCMDDILGYASGRELDFSYPKFFYYLLSPEFIEKYIKDILPIPGVLTNTEIGIIRVGKAIWNHQSGNSQPLIDLLSKI